MAPLARQPVCRGIDKNDQGGIANLFGHFGRELMALDHFDPGSILGRLKFLRDAPAGSIVRTQWISISNDQNARPIFGRRGIAHDAWGQFSGRFPGHSVSPIASQFNGQGRLTSSSNSPAGFMRRT